VAKLRLTAALLLTAGLLFPKISVAQSVAVAAPPAAASEKISPTPDKLTAARALFQQGRFKEAVAVLAPAEQINPTADAYALEVRSLLKLDDVTAAESKSQHAVELFPRSAIVLAARGDALFRRGLMADAEDQYRAALKLNDSCERAWLGMGRIYSAASRRKDSKDAYTRAHELDPTDGDAYYYWALGLQYPQNVTELEKHLAGFPDDAERERHEREYIDFLKALRGRKVWVPVKQPEHAELKLQAVLSDSVPRPRSPLSGAQSVLPPADSRLRGFSLQVRLNDKANASVMLDTGASGLTISRKLAEKAGAIRLSEHSLEGVGNAGPAKGYEAWLDKVTVGEFEFHDCHVHVSPQENADYDGLIGTDLFDDFLVTVDFPGRKLHLEPLPKAPEQPPTSAPANFTQIYRFGHIMLIPTTVGKSARGLFVLDTGAFTNSISPQLAQQVTTVRKSDVYVKGVSGSVANVFSADEATLHFSRFSQPNESMATFDVNGLSKDLGTEVSGFIGFATLRKMQMIINYRDGLVNFDYRQ
jgi:tetratricopeptide (TPR) repeat protein